MHYSLKCKAILLMMLVHDFCKVQKTKGLFKG